MSTDSRLPSKFNLCGFSSAQYRNYHSPRTKNLSIGAHLPSRFLRCRGLSEYTAGGLRSEKGHCIRRSDDYMHCFDLHNSVPSSKIDRFKHGYFIKLNLTLRSVCPAQTCVAYASTRHGLGAHNKPFSCLKDGRYLTRLDLSKVLQNFLKNLPSGHWYSSHGFQICAATRAALCNACSQKLKRARCWRSDCYAS